MLATPRLMRCSGCLSQHRGSRVLGLQDLFRVLGLMGGFNVDVEYAFASACMSFTLSYVSHWLCVTSTSHPKPKSPNPKP